MTALHQIGSVEALLSNSPLSTSKLWWRDIESITGTELHAFIARMGYEGYGREARQNVEIALGEARRAAERGEIDDVQILRYALPTPRVTTGEIRSILARMSLPRRKATIFAAELEISPREAIELRWGKALKMRLTEKARWVLLGQPRHIKSDLVFWEYSRVGSVFPLLGFTEELDALLGNTSWWDFVSLYRSAVPYDYDADMGAFLTIGGRNGLVGQG